MPQICGQSGGERPDGLARGGARRSPGDRAGAAGGRRQPDGTHGGPGNAESRAGTQRVHAPAPGRHARQHRNRAGDLAGLCPTVPVQRLLPIHDNLVLYQNWRKIKLQGPSHIVERERVISMEQISRAEYTARASRLSWVKVGCREGPTLVIAFPLALHCVLAIRSYSYSSRLYKATASWAVFVMHGDPFCGVEPRVQDAERCPDSG